MSSSNIWLVLMLMLQAAAAAEEDNEAPELRLGVEASLKKKQHLDDIPHDSVVLFKSILYMQTAICCLVLLNGVLHLNCWSTLFQKCFRAKARPQYSESYEEELEMVERERDGATSDRDMIVNLSDSAV